MGFMRKAFILGTGGAGAALVKPNSKKERTANAAEKQLRLQKQMLRASVQDTQISAPRASAPRTVRVGCPYCSKPHSPLYVQRRNVVVPIGKNIECPKCGRHFDVVGSGGRTRAIPHNGGQPPNTPATRPENGKRSPLGLEIERLAQLHEQGALTDRNLSTQMRHFFSEIREQPPRSWAC
jgi:hypothetical protein